MVKVPSRRNSQGSIGTQCVRFLPPPARIANAKRTARAAKQEPPATGRATATAAAHAQSAPTRAAHATRAVAAAAAAAGDASDGRAARETLCAAAAPLVSRRRVLRQQSAAFELKRVHSAPNKLIESSFAPQALANTTSSSHFHTTSINNPIN